ncbi:MAG: hypothetical protein KAH18_02335 [Psychromonas sp.]|nr:hypothetical protein [Psychromonas sp.]
MSKSPCAWPRYPFYGVVGVCWNLTNRALYYTGKTVHNVQFYPIIEDYFGTYGLDDNSTCLSPLCMKGREKFSWSTCKRATKANFPWQGKKLNLLTGKKGIDPRIALYNKYYSKNKVAELQGIAPKELRKRYLASLMDLNINEHLGANFPEARRAVLQDIRLKLQDRLNGLEVSAATHKDYLDEFNLAVNQSLDGYRAVLSEKEYEKFMNASKKEVYDVRINNK